MSTPGALSQIFRGDAVTNPAGIACAARLRRDLAVAGIDAVLLANLTLGPKRLQIDLIVATAVTAIVVEIKGYTHSLEGGVNGPWSIAQDDGGRRALDGANPYQHALDNCFAVTDSLRGGYGGDHKHTVGGMLRLYPAAPFGSKIPTGDRKPAIGGYADLFALL